MNKIKCLFADIRLMTIVFWINWNDSAYLADLQRWKNICKLQGSDRRVTAILLNQYPEYRNLFIYRNRYRKLFRLWIKIWYKPMDTLYIEAKEIGGGLFIQHGFATMISAESIGKNCWVNQQVTIGYSSKGNRAPIIGDNVMITCGAKVLGSITVEDNVIIGANAVVIHDVEAGTVMGGVPAHRIK